MNPIAEITATTVDCDWEYLKVPEPEHELFRDDFMRDEWEWQRKQHDFHTPKWGHNKPRFRT